MVVTADASGVLPDLVTGAMPQILDQMRSSTFHIRLYVVISEGVPVVGLFPFRCPLISAHVTPKVCHVSLQVPAQWHELVMNA